MSTPKIDLEQIEAYIDAMTGNEARRHVESPVLKAIEEQQKLEYVVVHGVATIKVLETKLNEARAALSQNAAKAAEHRQKLFKLLSGVPTEPHKPKE